MARSPRRPRAGRADRPVRGGSESSNPRATKLPLTRLVKPALAAFVCMPVLGVLLIAQGQLHVQIPPETVYAATAALLGAAGSGCHRGHRRR